MTPERQRIVIAEECGWTMINSSGIHPVGFDPAKKGLSACAALGRVPDYCNDLNAMHEAWNTLNRKQRIANSVFLRTKIVHDGGHATSFKEDIDACVENATAAQRAEAFLRTIGKWEEYNMAFWQNTEHLKPTKAGLYHIRIKPDDKPAFYCYLDPTNPIEWDIASIAFWQGPIVKTYTFGLHEDEHVVYDLAMKKYIKEFGTKPRIINYTEHNLKQILTFL